MDLGLEVKEARLHKGMTQADVARRMNLDKSVICKWENGMTIPTEGLRALVLVLDDARLYMAAEEAVSPCAVPWLDGEGIDLHRVSVQVKLLEELEQASIAVKNLKLVNKPQTASERLITDIEDAMQQVLDAVVCGRTWVGVMCEAYGKSPAETHGKHHRKLEVLSYKRTIKKRPAVRASR